jgi:hypothetical protein
MALSYALAAEPIDAAMPRVGESPCAKALSADTSPPGVAVITRTCGVAPSGAGESVAGGGTGVGPRDVRANVRGAPKREPAPPPSAHSTSRRSTLASVSCHDADRRHGADRGHHGGGGSRPARRHFQARGSTMRVRGRRPRAPRPRRGGPAGDAERQETLSEMRRGVVASSSAPPSATASGGPPEPTIAGTRRAGADLRTRRG